jgi:hypothetical protein
MAMADVGRVFNATQDSEEDSAFRWVLSFAVEDFGRPDVVHFDLFPRPA